jgi:hypothetical protein
LTYNFAYFVSSRLRLAYAAAYLFPRSCNTCAAFAGLSLRTALSVCPVRAVGTAVAASPDPPLDKHETIPNPDHLPKYAPPIRYYSSHPIRQLGFVAVVSLPVRAEIGCAQCGGLAREHSLLCN